MSVSLIEATRRDRAAKNRPAPILPASAYMLTGAELARECASAVRSYAPARALSDAERDALAAILSATVTERMGRGRTRAQIMRNGASRTPADVLRYVARCERFPTLMEGREGIPRSAVGREYLRRECASLMRDSREWRDAAESYATATQRERESAPMVVSAETFTDADALTRASAREVERVTGEPLPALPIMSNDVAHGMSLALAADGAPRRAVLVALCMGAGVPLASVALALGFSLVTAKRESAAGAAWLRGCDTAPGPITTKRERDAGVAHCAACKRAPHASRVPAAQLVALMRETADAYGHVIPARPDVPSLPASAKPAAAAVEACQREARKLATLAGCGC